MPSVPDPANVKPWYLRNITEALALDEVTGNVYIRTGFEGNIVISGNVNVPGNIDAHVVELGNVDISGNTMPISGNVTITGGNIAITSIPEVEIKNDSGNAIPVTANYNNFTVGFNSTQTDAFGRFRVSEPFTLFDSFHRYQDNGKINSYTANGGTTSYNSASGTVSMNVTTASGSTVIRESTKVFSYQPGKSLLILQTFVLAPPQIGLTQRFGYFSAENGFYLQVVDNQASFVRRSSSSGSIVNTVINRQDWNVDSFDGTGPSGLTLDLSKAQILWHDLEWLGVGSVRSGFVVNGAFYTGHVWHHANSVTTSYMTTACLPVRAEIFTTSAISSSASLTVICTSIQSEGGYTLTGRSYTASNLITAPTQLPNDQTFKPVMSIRLKSNRLDAIVLPKRLVIAPTGQSVFKYQIYLSGTTTGGSWVSAGTNSSVEYNLSPTSVVTGAISSSGFIVSSNQSSSSIDLSDATFKNQLERNTFTSTPYEFIVTVSTVGTNQEVFTSLGWEEIT